MSFASVRRVVVATALSLALVTATSVDAEATTDYTPAGGPSVNMVGTSVRFLEEEAAQTFSCSRFDVAGQIVTPGTVRAYDSEAVDLGTPTDTCTHPIFGHVNFDADPDWKLSITGSPSGSSWPARLDQVDMTLSAGGCELAFEGFVAGTFDTATQRFAPTTSALVVTYRSGSLCAALDFQVGDRMVLQGHLTNTAPSGSGPMMLS